MVVLGLRQRCVRHDFLATARYQLLLLVQSADYFVAGHGLGAVGKLSQSQTRGFRVPLLAEAKQAVVLRHTLPRLAQLDGGRDDDNGVVSRLAVVVLRRDGHVLSVVPPLNRSVLGHFRHRALSVVVNLKDFLKFLIFAESCGVFDFRAVDACSGPFFIDATRRGSFLLATTAHWGARASTRGADFGSRNHLLARWRLYSSLLFLIVDRNCVFQETAVVLHTVDVGGLMQWVRIQHHSRMLLGDLLVGLGCFLGPLD